MSATLAAFFIALAGQTAAPPVQDLASAYAAYTPPPRKLEVTFDSQGRVTISAAQVTVSEILAEWARKGGTKITGAERLTGGVIQVPMLFENRPELEVIEALTRQAAGISVAPRRVGGTQGASRFESIYIVATSAASASSPYPSAPTYGGSAPPVRGFPDDEVPPVTAPGARDPQQQPQAPQQPGARPANSPSGSPSPVIVPVVPVGGTPTAPPPGGRGGGGTPPPTTTGRGGGGGR